MRQITIPNSQRDMELKGMDCMTTEMSQPCYRAVLCKFVNRHTCKKWLFKHQQLREYELNKIGR